MDRASEIFKRTRLGKNISLKKVAEETKIPRQYLEAIEKENQKVFPNYDYAQLYVRDYAAFLGLSPLRLVRIFRRDWEGEAAANLEIRKRNIFLEKAPLLTSSTLVAGFLIVLAVIYLVRQYVIFNSPPKLSVHASCGSEKVLVEGKTSKEAAVKIDGQAVLVSPRGEFSKEVNSYQDEDITIVSQSPTGKISEKVIEPNCP
ncbi:MAG: helix-turn-helix domain-containing protein [Candidatus Shapirobacteria bacterium]